MKDSNGNPTFLFPCTANTNRDPNGSNCYLALSAEILEASAFTVISLSSSDPSVRSTAQLQRKLIQILSHGSIPVILGLRFLPPFHELIDWSQIIVKVPSQRILQLPAILRNYPESVKEALRANGRLAFIEYLSNSDKIVSTLLATIGSRLSLPGIYYLPGSSQVHISGPEAVVRKI